MAATPEPSPPPEDVSAAPSRSDARSSRRRILRAAAELSGDRHVTFAELAAAAQVSRSTLYRHFPTREALERAVAQAFPAPSSRSGDVEALPYQAPGRLGRDAPMALEVTRILDEVPPHLVPEQLVAEARRVGGVASALYIVDIDGAYLLRLAGTDEFPARLPAPPALGPEIVPEGLPEFHEHLRERLPGCTSEPLWLRGRVTGILLCLGTPVAPLHDVAKQGAAALELADDYTDFIAAARRRKATTPAAEVQQNLFPPRITRIAGAQLAGVLLPVYEVGGDWFDFVENRDGAWLAIADATGTGPTAAGLGAAALGALRAARRSGADLEQALALMDETIRRLEHDDFRVPAWVARWHAPTATLSWVAAGHSYAFLFDVQGALSVLDSPERPPLGTPQAGTDFTVCQRQLHSGERLVLVTDGVMDRPLAGGGSFGAEGIARALAQDGGHTAAASALAIQRAVREAGDEPLGDDATVVVMAIG